MRQLSDRDRERLRWMQLYLRLPACGVAAYFPDDASCEQRMVELRWPEGMHCIRCDADRIKTCHTRKTFRCKECAHEFSLKANTVMFRSRHTIRDWFLAAEEHITLHAFGQDHLDTGHSMADRHCVAYTTAYRLRVKLACELAHDHSLLLTSICISELQVPQDVVQNDFDFYVWLLDTCVTQRQMRRQG
ncbi:Transposase zinc-ribbon domain protein [Roseovarius mucosus DSM 17069]|uniref:Transposase zinc-ribbon domain protein n=1 Tax=Roseovarius mucosus DSM 17069 TaxID=1288298 RepID=A0A0A0HPG5_9RHOB|nr:transposase [Roseovarius mucosus]KGM88841.1 Transposase zinc-ribbon domain protein [Roseovarius mucosus DSM 17069]